MPEHSVAPKDERTEAAPGEESSRARSVEARSTGVRRLETVFWLVLALGALQAVHVCLNGALILHVPFETMRPEAFILHGARRVATGQPLYTDFRQIPYVVMVYNPLTYLPAGLAGRWFQLGFRGMTLVGRYVSYVSTLLLAAVLGFCAWKATRHWGAASLAALGVFFFHSIGLTDFFRFRPESPGLLFTFAGVAVFLSTWRHRQVAAAALFFVAFLFKQSFVAAPVSVFLFLLATRRWRALLLFSLTLGWLLAIFFIVMYRVTDGLYFRNTFFALAVNEVRPIEAFVRQQGAILLRSLYGLVAAVSLAIVLLGRAKRHLFLVVYFAVSLFWSFYSAGKVGAGVNYYSEWVTASILIVALATGLPERRGGIVLSLILLALSIQVIDHLYTRGLLRRQIAIEQEDISRHVALYRRLPGRKLITYDAIAVRTDQVVALDWVLLEHLEKRGAIDLKPLFQRISQGEFDVIVLGQHPMTRLEMQILGAVRSGPYRLVGVDAAISQWNRL